MDLLEERRADRYRRSRRQASARRSGHSSPRGSWRPGGAWALIVVLAVGLVAGGVIGWSLAPTGQRNQAGTAPAVPQSSQTSAACRAVLAKADEGLSVAVRIERVLTDQTRVMDQLARGGVSPARAVAASRQALARGSGDAARLDAALADYLSAADDCRGP
ncbi:MAG TPA: hypothetical protein VNK73_05550 [Actinomycetota bacterium]|jgi:hypothetical protein|nr:hypothetical protein [Actinomycetota bacterium]